MTREDIAQYSYRYAGNWKAVEQAILQEEKILITRYMNRISLI